jgi:hypothetical protein
MAHPLLEAITTIVFIVAHLTIGTHLLEINALCLHNLVQLNAFLVSPRSCLQLV